MTPFISAGWFKSRVERAIELDELPMAPLINEMLKRTEGARRKAAASRTKFYRDVAWLAKRARIQGSFVKGENLAVLMFVAPPNARSLGDVDGRIKCSLDAFNSGHAGIWPDDRQVSVLMVERLAAETPRGRMHMIVGVIPAWPAYEAAKSAWIVANPTATQAQYDAAMRSITEKIGA